jgi:DNA-binding FrmR family transcriptional regulator
MSVQQVADAALCVSLARQIDATRGAVAAAAAAKQLHDIMTALRLRAQAERPGRSQIDEIRERRARDAAARGPAA